ncbi:probable NOT transcription complex subunit VIP2 [Macadamia integrifolia]|uniref:probable NOT transcription complex subunit VIP2 n=1 Tax=Macadamia integrifolia TaxID=60698 RepID=UPI001C4FB980|nr:probable NOT transcription complex subunit VIP2 [Macadamia integrifolia]
MSGLLNSGLNGSSSNISDNAGRPYGSSFSVQSASTSPVFHHTGSVQGLHNIHGSFNIPNMPGTLASRNSAMNGVPSNGAQQPVGSLSSGRFASNNLHVALSQMSHASSHGHSGVTNRGGLGVSPILGNTGPRITTSMGNIVGAGNMGRNLSSGGGLSMPGLASRLNLTGNNGSGSLSVQGPNRLMGGVLPQAPQVLSLLGNSYSGGGPLSQSQVQGGNNTLSSMGMLNDVNSNDNSPFDINDFPQLSGRPSSAGSSQGQLGSLRKQSVGVIQQNQEFSIQNEDFPALPGYKGGNTDYSMDLHQKEQLNDSAMSMMQAQHYPMGRSSGFSLGGTYSSHRQQQQQQAPSVGGTGVSFGGANNQDLLHMHGSDLFPSSHAGYHSQVQNNGPPNIGLRPINNPNSISGMGSYDQLIQQYQQLQSQSQFRLQQMSAVNQSYRDQNLKAMQAVSDRFGLLGLLGVIKMSNPNLNSLALGTDLTTLGLNLSSTNDIHKKFASPWSDEPAKGEHEYTVPECYYAKPPPVLHQGYFSKFQPETLFYIFYSMPRDEAQLYAANELYNRGWFYHRELRLWLIRVSNMEPLVKTNTYERGSYLCFDPNTWETVRKDNFVLHYEMLEKRPVSPQH